jgi:O-antigen ligase
MRSCQLDRVANAPRLLEIRTWLFLGTLLYFATDGRILLKSKEFGDRGAGLPATPAQRATLVIVWLLAIALTFQMAPRLLKLCMRYRAFAGLAVLSLLSVLWSPDFLDALRRSVLCALTIFFAVAMAEIFSEYEQMTMVLLTGCLAALSSLAVMYLLPSYGAGYAGEWKGIFGHKNDLGIYILFLVSPALFLKFDRVMRKVAISSVVVLSCVLVLKSESRTAWVLAALLAAYCVISRLLRHFKKLDSLIIFALLLLAITALIYVVFVNGAAVASSLGKGSDLSGRTRIWEAVLVAIAKRPLLGYGYGGFWNQLEGESFNVISAVGFSLNHAHNGYLNLMLQLGIAGLAMFLWTLGRAILDWVHCYLAGERDSYLLWCGAVLLLVVVGNLDESFILKYSSLVAMLYIVVCIGLRERAKELAVG